MPHLKLDQSLVDEARALAHHIVAPVIDYIEAHTTVAIERATLRLLGVDGVDEAGVPLPNRVVDNARALPQAPSRALPGPIRRPGRPPSTAPAGPGPHGSPVSPGRA